MTTPQQYSEVPHESPESERANDREPDMMDDRADERTEQETTGRTVDADSAEVDAGTVDQGTRAGDVDSDMDEDSRGRDTDRAETMARDVGATDTDTGDRERLVPRDHADSYSSRWDSVKGMFVDEPREAVAQADALVGEVLDELEKLFREQRHNIEQGLDSDETSTEDLRLALRRYRSFFDRLLSV